jgi:hypothetical protein
MTAELISISLTFLAGMFVVGLSIYFGFRLASGLQNAAMDRALAMIPAPTEPADNTDLLDAISRMADRPIEVFVDFPAPAPVQQAPYPPAPAPVPPQAPRPYQSQPYQTPPARPASFGNSLTNEQRDRLERKRDEMKNKQSGNRPLNGSAGI